MQRVGRCLALAAGLGLIALWRSLRRRAGVLPTWAEELLQAIPDGVIAFDARQRVTFFNQGAARLTGWEEAEAHGRKLADVLNLSDHDWTRLNTVFESTRPLHLTTQGKPPVTLAVSGARWGGPQRTVAVIVLRDVTDEETGRSLHSYFLAHISHEFRTPLSGLNASIELLMDEIGYLSPAEIDELLNSIHLSASGLKALVDNLLESVNIEAGKFTIHRRSVEVNQVLADAIRMMQPLLDRRKQTLTLTEPLQIPPVFADPTRLTQVMLNLLSNASKYSPLTSTIDLALERSGDWLRITVADRGPGISPTERENLFSRFVRLNAPDAEQAGVGLGLSVVKAIVEEHRGKVGVGERVGGGSIFWLTLPLEASQ